MSYLLRVFDGPSKMLHERVFHCSDEVLMLALDELCLIHTVENETKSARHFKCGLSVSFTQPKAVNYAAGITGSPLPFLLGCFNAYQLPKTT